MRDAVMNVQAVWDSWGTTGTKGCDMGWIEYTRVRRISLSSGDMLRYHKDLRLRRSIPGRYLKLWLESVGKKQAKTPG